MRIGQAELAQLLKHILQPEEFAVAAVEAAESQLGQRAAGGWRRPPEVGPPIPFCGSIQTLRPLPPSPLSDAGRSPWGHRPRGRPAGTRVA
jgi:hypothetical protein